MDLIATKSVKHGSARHEPGDIFTANNRDGRILIAIGKARLADVPSNSAPPAPSNTQKPATAKTGKAKGKYKRRDMTAEQSKG